MITTTFNIIMLIYLSAAILPAIWLMRYIYVNDQADKEPPGLLLNLILQGVLAAFLAIVLETLGQKALGFSGLNPKSETYIILLAFLVVAVAEEGSKMYFLYKRTWNDPNFDYHFDGIIYAVFVSLGFAAFENVKYVFSYGLGVALPRALLAIPGHMSFAVLMGTFYGRAKYHENRGHKIRRNWNLAIAFICSVALHGIYDTCAMIGSTNSTILFVAVILIVYSIVYSLVKKASREDYHL